MCGHELTLTISSGYHRHSKSLYKLVRFLVGFCFIFAYTLVSDCSPITHQNKHPFNSVFVGILSILFLKSGFRLPIILFFNDDYMHHFCARL